MIRVRGHGPELAVIAFVGLAVGTVSGIELASARSAGVLAALPAEELVVPRATTAPTIDGELDDATWSEPGGRTGPFTTGGATAKPYSDARVVWRDGTLYLALYAADEDIIAPMTAHDGPLWTGDSFRVVFRRGEQEFAIEVSPRGVVTDGSKAPGGLFDARWESGVRVGVDRDGTVDDPSDEDEEWIVEMAIPMNALGLTGTPGERIGLEIARCDRVRMNGGGTQKRCASWGDARSTLVLR